MASLLPSPPSHFFFSNADQNVARDDLDGDRVPPISILSRRHLASGVLTLVNCFAADVVASRPWFFKHVERFLVEPDIQLTE